MSFKPPYERMRNRWYSYGGDASSFAAEARPEIHTIFNELYLYAGAPRARPELERLGRETQKEFYRRLREGEIRPSEPLPPAPHTERSD